MTISVLKKNGKESMLGSILLLFGLLPWECDTQLLIIIFPASWICEVFKTFFSCLCPHHLKTGLFQLSNHKWAREAEKLWWWSSLWVSKTILFNLFEKAAEVLISVFIKRKPFLGQLNPTSICVETQTYNSSWDEEQGQHLIPQPGILP